MISPVTISPEDMGRIWDLAAEVSPASMALDDHTLYAMLTNALLAEHEVEARNLASRRNISRDEKIQAKREQYH